MFNKSTAVATNSNSHASTPSNDSWKAQGFLNFYLPSKDGKKVKLGAIPLKDSIAKQKDLIEWLNEDPARASVILAKLVIEYQSAVPAEGSGFDL